MCAVLEQAVRSGRIRSNPARGLALPRPHRRDHVFLTHGQLAGSRIPPVAGEVAASVQGKNPDDLVFTTVSGSVVCSANWRQKVFLPARKQAGISDRFRINDLRHTAAALMIQAGYPPKMLQEILGHASIATTLDLYGHLYPGDMDKYADRLDDAAASTGTAKIRPEDEKDDPEESLPSHLAGKLWRARRSRRCVSEGLEPPTF
jgi:integrase